MEATCYTDAMSDNDQLLSAEKVARPQGLGCAGTLAGINLVLMGLMASAFAFGSYSSAAQEDWYRGGSIALLVFGAILPVAALLFIARRRRGSVTAVTIWLGVSLIVFIYYVFMSGGGV